MRTKNLILALALPMAFAACQSDELLEKNATTTDDNLVELEDGFLLAVQKGANETATKAVWEVASGGLNWAWFPEIDANGTESLGKSSSALNVYADRIGLCWTGEVLGDEAATPSSKVMTNYEFLHYGWLAEGQSSASIDPCDGALENGRVYSNIDLTPAAGSITSSSDMETNLKVIRADANDVSINGTNKHLNPNSGVFQTSNKAIFGGSYIVYYPYDPDFKNTDYLPAKAETNFEVTENDLNDVSAAYVAKNTFGVGYAKDLIGGTQANTLSLDPLSSIISLQLVNVGTSEVEVKRVALWSNDGFVASVGLDAAKIKASGAAAGEQLYVAGTKVAASTIVATLKNELKVSQDAEKPNKIYLPVLPTTAKDLKVIVYRKDDAIAVIDYGTLVCKAKSAAVVKVEVAAKNFSNSILAVDAASFKTAVEKTYSSATNVTVIGNIVLTEDVSVKKNVTVAGDGKVIVAHDTKMTLEDGATVEATVDVEGQPCCNTTDPGTMVVNGGASVAGKVNVLASEYANVGKSDGVLQFEGTKASTVTAASTINNNGIVNFTGVTNVLGTLNVSDYAYVGIYNETAAGEPNVNVKGGVVNNNGTFEVASGRFAIMTANEQTTSEIGKNFKNNGTFIDNIGTTIGAATQHMIQNGEYICKVNDQTRLNEAYASKTAASTIQFVVSDIDNVGFDLKNAVKHNNKSVKLLIEGSNVKEAVLYNSTANNITVGALTVNSKGAIKVVTVTDKDGNEVEPGAIKIDGNIVVNGALNVRSDVQGMTANNLTVNRDGNISFQKRVKKVGVTMAIASTITVNQYGKLEIVQADAANLPADVTCKKLVNNKGTIKGEPRVL